VRFRVIDIETTGLTPPAEIIEIGCVDVVAENGVIAIEPPRSQLFRPLHGISPETMAVHHITERDFQPDTPSCSDALLFSLVNADPAPDVLVAHNCEFEQRFISGFASNGLPWICTHKTALRVWPDAPRHSNQVLRYWRGLVLDEALAMPPHRAGPDAAGKAAEHHFRQAQGHQVARRADRLSALDDATEGHERRCGVLRQ
jgi:exodeoxyribonuclease X